MVVRVLLLDNWKDEARAELAKVCDDVTFPCFAVTSEDIDGLIVGLGQYPKWCAIKEFPNLKFVASPTTGLDHIDLDYCKSHNIAVLSLQGDTEFLRGVHATAEHCVGLMLSLLRHIPQAHADVCAGRGDREAWQGSELHDKYVGVVGAGRVGEQVMRLLYGFGCAFLAHDLHEMHYGQHVETLDELLRRSDIVTLHVPLNNSTRNLIGEAQLRLMKPCSVLINTSRGAVIDEAALLRALREGWIAGAALDVMCDEPNVNYELICYTQHNDNLILTPHLAGNTAESRLKTQLRMCEKIRDFIGGGSNDHVNP